MTKSEALANLLPMEVKLRILEIAENGLIQDHKEELFDIWDRYLRMKNNPISRRCPKCVASTLTEIGHVVQVLKR